MENNEIKKNGISVKKVLRFLSFVCLVMLFCPSFLVSCSGQPMNINVFVGIAGIDYEGSKIVQGNPLLVLCILLPVVVLFLLFVSKSADHKTAGIIAGCSALDMFTWFVFRSRVEDIARSSYCTFQSTTWYYVNILALLLMIGLSVMSIMRKAQLDIPLGTLLSGVTGGMAAGAAPDRMSGSAGQFISGTEIKMLKPENIIGYCPKCGTPVGKGNRFCMNCGAGVPESMAARAENKAEGSISVAYTDTTDKDTNN